MKFCYYCGAKLRDEDAFCGACGKRDVSAGAEEAARVQSAEEAFVDVERRPHQSRAARQNPHATDEPEPSSNNPQTHKIAVTGDLHSSIFATRRDLCFIGQDGRALFIAYGKKGDADSAGEYEIRDGSDECVAKVKFNSSEEKPFGSALFSWRRPPKPPAKGLLEKLVRAIDTEFDSKWFQRPDDVLGDLLTLGGLLAKKKVKVVGQYKAETEGSPAKTDVYFKGTMAATIRPDKNSYCIEYANPEHGLTAVMVFLAVYMQI